jgi:predicted helicase
MAINEKAMKAATSLDEVIAFLSDQLGWPVDASELEKSTFKYTPDELGVDATVGDRINSIRQIRPVTVNQPWGIFLLDLSGTTLTKKTIREVLKGLTAKRRAEKQPGSWNKENLLFIVSSGRDQDFQIHFLSFKSLEQAKTEIRTLDWNPIKSPPQKIRRLSRELLPHLSWPHNQQNAESWLNSWGSAFRVPLGTTISDASALAKRMADVAIKLRDTILAGLEKENGKGPLSALLVLIRDEIDSDADKKTFADMCAQTITYGLLAARVNDPEGFAASPVFDSFSLSDEFLESLFAEVQEAISLPHEDTASIESLAADLKSTNVEAILDEFGNSTDGGDPVIHFYEQFLFLYDREMRMSAGAFYTPKPVVDTMVRMVDELLVSKFGLVKGFADESSWSQVCNFLDIPVPPDKEPNSRFLSILDPATGTGTYLVSVIERVKANLVKAGMSEGSLQKHMSSSTVPRLTAFELMLGPYSIANLKLGLAHHGEDGNFPKTVFLTNTLDLDGSAEVLFEESNAISSEGQAALERKLHEPFTVIIGNPPYGRDTQKEGGFRSDNERTGGAMRHPSPHFEYPPIQDFIEGLTEAGVEKRRGAQVYNLYTYFWRWSIWQVLQKNISYSDSLIQKQNLSGVSPGVVAFITASSFVSADSFSAMRSYMRSQFDEIYVIDLGGSALIGGDDPNIFPIQTAVAICIGVRTSGSSDMATVKYRRIEGSRATKLERLSSLSLSSLVDSSGSKFSSFAPAEDDTLSKHIDLTSFFQLNSSSCLPKRTWVVSPSKRVLEERWARLVQAETADELNELLKASATRNAHSTPIPFLDSTAPRLRPLAELKSGDSPEAIIKYSYRPFDNQYLVADMRVIGQPSLFRQIRHETQFWLGSGQNITNGPSIIAYKYLPDFDAFRGFGGGKDFFPAYLDPQGKESNLSAFAKRYLSEVAPGADARVLLEYLYAIHGSGAYAEIYSNELRHGDHRAKVPLITNSNLFDSISAVGKSLLDLHLSEELSDNQKLMPRYLSSVEKIDACPISIKYDSKSETLFFDDQKFCLLASDIWNFSVGRHKVVQSFLMNRKRDPKGRRSSPLDYINEEAWTYTDDFVKMVADVSAILEAKKLVLPLLKIALEDSET